MAVVRVLRPEFLLGGCVLDPKMDEGEGTSVKDTSGYGNHGNITGAVWTDGYYEKALSFDGVDDYVIVPNVVTNKNEMSFSVWAKTNSITKSQDILDAANPSSPYDGFLFSFRSDGTIWVRWDNLGSTKQLAVSGQLDLNWNHWGIVIGNSKIELYKNGKSVGVYSTTIDTITSNYEFRIGRFISGTSQYDGLIGEVRIYNRALTPQEILDHYIIGKEMFG